MTSFEHPLDDRISEKRAAAILGVSPSTMKVNWRRGKRKGPVFHKINRNKGYYSLQEVEAFLAEESQKPPVQRRKTASEDPTDYDWSWVTPESYKALRLASRKRAKYCSIPEEDIFVEACLHIAVRPDWFNRSRCFWYDSAASAAAATLEHNSPYKQEQIMSEEYWRLQ